MGLLQKSLTTQIITHLTGANNYTWLHYKNGKRELFSKPLHYFQTKLPNFIRIHRTALVNPLFVETIQLPTTKKKSGSLTMQAGLTLPISRRRVVLIEMSSLAAKPRV